MRKCLMMAMLATLLLVFCGAPEEAPKAEIPAEKAEGDVYYTMMSEAEIQKFIKVFPTFRAEMEKLDEDWESGGGPDAFKAMMAMNKEIPELDARLKAAGMPWAEFGPAMGKTFMALGAVFMDSMMVGMKEQMKGMQDDMAKETMKSMEEANAAYKDIPQGNKDLVKKYLKELQAILDVD